MKVQPYLFFDGRCEEALDYYKKTVGADVTFMMRFKESPDKEACASMPPNAGEKIMHAAFKIGETLIMASDGMSSGNPEFKGFSLSIHSNSEAEADKLFNALADGGKVQAPISKTFFARKFGMVADKFGMNWMVIVE
jgi:PhnB protein